MLFCLFLWTPHSIPQRFTKQTAWQSLPHSPHLD